MELNLKNNQFTTEKISECWQLIKKANKVTFLTHYRPDGDGISACAALSKICEHLCKDIETIYPNKPEFDYTRQPKNILINKHKQIPDLIIVCDTANYERMYFHPDFEMIPMINIDHHISNSINADFNFVDGQASSTCEILFHLMKKWNHNLIDKYVAECLLMGILYDTQVFHTQGVTPQTLIISADLIEEGANLFELKKELLSSKNPEIIKLWGYVLQNVQIDPEKNVAWAKISQEEMKKIGVTPTCLIGFNNFLAELSDIDITLIFYETKKGKTKVSLRSKKYDVNLLASIFGGGGHKNAAGILSDKPMDELIKEILKEI
ncbi:MAG: bifunctional oligoribonuclease/PAP phosphatase NrnA [bacterium]